MSFLLPGQLGLTFNYEGSLLLSPAAGQWGPLLPGPLCHSLWLLDCLALVSLPLLGVNETLDSGHFGSCPGDLVQCMGGGVAMPLS